MYRTVIQPKQARNGFNTANEPPPQICSFTIVSTCERNILLHNLSVPCGNNSNQIQAQLAVSKSDWTQSEIAPIWNQTCSDTFHPIPTFVSMTSKGTSEKLLHFHLENPLCIATNEEWIFFVISDVANFAWNADNLNGLRSSFGANDDMCFFWPTGPGSIEYSFYDSRQSTSSPLPSSSSSPSSSVLRHLSDALCSSSSSSSRQFASTINVSHELMRSVDLISNCSSSASSLALAHLYTRTRRRYANGFYFESVSKDEHMPDLTDDLDGDDLITDSLLQKYFDPAQFLSLPPMRENTGVYPSQIMSPLPQVPSHASNDQELIKSKKDSKHDEVLDQLLLGISAKSVFSLYEDELKSSEMQSFADFGLKDAMRAAVKLHIHEKLCTQASFVLKHFDDISTDNVKKTDPLFQAFRLSSAAETLCTEFDELAGFEAVAADSSGPSSSSSSSPSSTTSSSSSSPGSASSSLNAIANELKQMGIQVSSVPKAPSLSLSSILSVSSSSSTSGQEACDKALAKVFDEENSGGKNAVDEFIKSVVDRSISVPLAVSCTKQQVDRYLLQAARRSQQDSSSPSKQTVMYLILRVYSGAALLAAYTHLTFLWSSHIKQEEQTEDGKTNRNNNNNAWTQLVQKQAVVLNTLAEEGISLINHPYLKAPDVATTSQYKKDVASHRVQQYLYCLTLANCYQSKWIGFQGLPDQLIPKWAVAAATQAREYRVRIFRLAISSFWNDGVPLLKDRLSQLGIDLSKSSTSNFSGDSYSFDPAKHMDQITQMMMLFSQSGKSDYSSLSSSSSLMPSSVSDPVHNIRKARQVLKQVGKVVYAELSMCTVNFIPNMIAHARAEILQCSPSATPFMSLSRGSSQKFHFFASNLLPHTMTHFVHQMIQASAFGESYDSLSSQADLSKMLYKQQKLTGLFLPDPRDNFSYVLSKNACLLFRKISLLNAPTSRCFGPSFRAPDYYLSQLNANDGSKINNQQINTKYFQVTVDLLSDWRLSMAKKTKTRLGAQLFTDCDDCWFNDLKPWLSNLVPNGLDDDMGFLELIHTIQSNRDLLRAPELLSDAKSINDSKGNDDDGITNTNAIFYGDGRERDLKKVRCEVWADSLTASTETVVPAFWMSVSNRFPNHQASLIVSFVEAASYVQPVSVTIEFPRHVEFQIDKTATFYQTAIETHGFSTRNIAGDKFAVSEPREKRGMVVSTHLDQVPQLVQRTQVAGKTVTFHLPPIALNGQKIIVFIPIKHDGSLPHLNYDCLKKINNKDALANYVNASRVNEAWCDAADEALPPHIKLVSQVRDNSISIGSDSGSSDVKISFKDQEIAFEKKRKEHPYEWNPGYEHYSIREQKEKEKEDIVSRCLHLVYTHTDQVTQPIIRQLAFGMDTKYQRTDSHLSVYSITYQTNEDRKHLGPLRLVGYGPITYPFTEIELFQPSLRSKSPSAEFIVFSHDDSLVVGNRSDASNSHLAPPPLFNVADKKSSNRASRHNNCKCKHYYDRPWRTDLAESKFVEFDGSVVYETVPSKKGFFTIHVANIDFGVHPMQVSLDTEISKVGRLYRDLLSDFKKHRPFQDIMYYRLSLNGCLLDQRLSVGDYPIYPGCLLVLHKFGGYIHQGQPMMSVRFNCKAMSSNNRSQSISSDYMNTLVLEVHQLLFPDPPDDFHFRNYIFWEKFDLDSSKFSTIRIWFPKQASTSWINRRLSLLMGPASDKWILSRPHLEDFHQRLPLGGHTICSYRKVSEFVDEVDPSFLVRHQTSFGLDLNDVSPTGSLVIYMYDDDVYKGADAVKLPQLKEAKNSLEDDRKSCLNKFSFIQHSCALFHPEKAVAGVIGSSHVAMRSLLCTGFDFGIVGETFGRKISSSRYNYVFPQVSVHHVDTKNAGLVPKATKALVEKHLSSFVLPMSQGLPAFDSVRRVVKLTNGMILNNIFTLNDFATRKDRLSNRKNVFEWLGLNPKEANRAFDLERMMKGGRKEEKYSSLSRSSKKNGEDDSPPSLLEVIMMDPSHGKLQYIEGDDAAGREVWQNLATQTDGSDKIPEISRFIQRSKDLASKLFSF